MAEETEHPSAGTEPAEQSQTPSSPSGGDMGELLSRIPGLSDYFGAEKPEEKPEPKEEPQVEEPPPEGPEIEPEDQPVEAKSEEEEKKPELPASVQKRIDKLVAQKHAAAERAEELEAKVRDLETRISQSPSLAPTPENPLVSVNSIDDLAKRASDAQRVKLWALENLDGGEVDDGKGGTTFLDGQKVKQLLSLSEGLLSQHIPERRQYLQNRAAFEAEAKKAYPNLYKAGTEENQTLNSWVKIFPAVQRFPDFQLIIMDALAGQKMRFAKSKSVNNGQKASRTPTLAAPSPSAGEKVQPKNVLSKDLFNKIATDRHALDAFSETLIGSGGS